MNRDEAKDSRRTETARLVARGETGDFDRLYERVLAPLRVWADVRIPKELRACLSAEDVVQEVWLRALGIFEAYDPARSPFRPWIFRVAKNVLLEATRALRRPDVRRRLQSGDSSLFRPEGLPDSITAVSRRIARDETLAEVVEALIALPAEERNLIVHCGLEGMNHAAVANLMGLGKEAVTKRWQRLRARLADEGLAELLSDEA